MGDVSAATEEGVLKPGSDECAEVGYSEALQCSMCNRLKEALPAGDKPGSKEAKQLVGECQACCNSEGDQNEVYPKGVMYVCPSQVELNQDVQDFVKRKAGAFKNLKVKYVDGARTTLLLLREDETEDDATTYVNIRGWKSDEIRDFVAMKLRKKKNQ